MGYNADKAREIPKVEAGTVVEGVIIDIQDGKARDFIKDTTALGKFRNPDESAINIVVEYKLNEKPARIERIFSYQVAGGETVYNVKSNIGKFKAFYGKLPSVGLKVKLSANAEGYFKLLM